MTIKLVVGLSNPGIQYSSTRHNAGAWYVNLLFKYHHKILKKNNKFFGYVGQLTLYDQIIRCLIPTTYMNMSGKAVIKMANYFHIIPEEIMIVHDELDLLPGTARLKFDGSHGGHNGLRDIITRLGNKTNFYRLRIGIGRPDDRNDIVSFVLSEPSDIEKKLIYDIINNIIENSNVFLQNKSIQKINQFILKKN